MNLQIDNSFTSSLPHDPNETNTRRQVLGASYSFVSPKSPSNPKLIHVSDAALVDLGISEAEAKSNEFLAVFLGQKPLNSSPPYAMNYGGHQFGQWSGQLGDGRAINIGEIVANDQRWTLQLKGAGETPYSRQGDGLAVLRSSIREHLCSEAMYHLGIPTTRSLSLMLTGDKVLRDVMYDGNPAYEKGAVVCRVSPSFIRFGNFQLHSARKEHGILEKLADYTISHFYPEIKSTGPQKYLDFFQELTNRTIDTIIHWQRVGFVHGVMNTDNMSALGLTIDYGPYGWLEGYDHHWTPNTTDANGKRYRFGHQPKIGLWNLLQLANALFPLIKDAKALEEILNSYNTQYAEKYVKMMSGKLGLQAPQEEDVVLFHDLEKTLHLAETDMTIFFRLLADVKENDSLEGALERVSDAFYDKKLSKETQKAWLVWLDQYQIRLKNEQATDEQRKQKMNSFNPKYVLRNYMAQLAIDQADQGDYALIDELYSLLKKPYDEQPDHEKWFAKRPEWARNKVGCSMLSCSS